MQHTKNGTTPPPILLDLFCGRGGWTNAAILQGWRCVGIDVINHGYPGDFIQAELPLPLDALLSHRPSLIVASPPCEEFARYHLPWIRGPVPSTVLLEWSIRLADVSPVPVLIECSRFAAQHVPGAQFVGSYALWGSIPALLPPDVPRRKMRHSGTDPAARAMIEPLLAEWIIHSFTPRGRLL